MKPKFKYEQVAGSVSKLIERIGGEPCEPCSMEQEVWYLNSLLTSKKVWLEEKKKEIREIEEQVKELESVLHGLH